MPGKMIYIYIYIYIIIYTYYIIYIYIYIHTEHTEHVLVFGHTEHLLFFEQHEHVLQLVSKERGAAQAQPTAAPAQPTITATAAAGPSQRRQRRPQRRRRSNKGGAAITIEPTLFVPLFFLALLLLRGDPTVGPGSGGGGGRGGGGRPARCQGSSRRQHTLTPSRSFFTPSWPEESQGGESTCHRQGYEARLLLPLLRLRQQRRQLEPLRQVRHHVAASVHRPSPVAHATAAVDRSWKSGHRPLPQRRSYAPPSPLVVLLEEADGLLRNVLRKRTAGRHERTGTSVASRMNNYVNGLELRSK